MSLGSSRAESCRGCRCDDTPNPFEVVADASSVAAPATLGAVWGPDCGPGGFWLARGSAAGLMDRLGGPRRPAPAGDMSRRSPARPGDGPRMAPMGVYARPDSGPVGVRLREPAAGIELPLARGGGACCGGGPGLDCEAEAARGSLEPIGGAPGGPTGPGGPWRPAGVVRFCLCRGAVVPTKAKRATESVVFDTGTTVPGNSFARWGLLNLLIVRVSNLGCVQNVNETEFGGIPFGRAGFACEDDDLLVVRGHAVS